MYDESSPLDSASDARLILFSKRNRDSDNVPPTQVDIGENYCSNDVFISLFSYLLKFNNTDEQNKSINK